MSVCYFMILDNLVGKIADWPQGTGSILEDLHNLAAVLNEFRL